MLVAGLFYEIMNIYIWLFIYRYKQGFCFFQFFDVENLPNFSHKVSQVYIGKKRGISEKWQKIYGKETLELCYIWGHDFTDPQTAAHNMHKWTVGT
jgi:hypothetical protein